MKHAVVIGGSVAGLLAARVLSDQYDRVTIIERDALPLGPEQRKGVPQGRHIHALLARGAQIMEELFPGILGELRAEGAVHMDQVSDGLLHQYGQWKSRFESGFMVHVMSRPFLEAGIRRRVSALSRVTLLPEATVTRLTTTPDKQRVTGVVIERASGEQSIEADLVVEAGGRGTRAPQWLKELGFGETPISTLRIDLAYCSALFQPPAEKVVDWKMMAVVAPPPALRHGTILEIEGGRWLVTLWGYFGDHPPTEIEGFKAFAKSMPVPQMYDAIASATPLTQLSLHKVPSQLRRNYERLERFPSGLVIMGDAVCSFNPIYGQGMATAALEAMELRRALRSQGVNGLPAYTPTLQKGLGKLVDMPWQMATSSDMAYPQAEGARPLGSGLLSKYTRRMLDLAAHDPVLNDAFLQVQHMLKSPTSLFHPRHVARVLLSRLPAAPSAPPVKVRPASSVE